MDRRNEVADGAVARRAFLRWTAGLVGAGVLTTSGLMSRVLGEVPRSAGADSPAPGGIPSDAPAGKAKLEVARFPEKTELILLTDRPPNLEMPAKYFVHDLTPNEAMFVRWHIGIIPTRVDLAEFRLKVGGHVESPLSLSVDQLKKDFEAVTVVAVNQCSGNSRSLFTPRVAGGQWGHGAVGNAKWTGVRLKDLLAKAKVKPGAVEVSFGGLDSAIIPVTAQNPGTPDYVKSLQIAKANDADVIVAYAQNDKELPMLNGFPLRLVVPGWFATYWVKALDEINVLDKAFEGFWMTKAYRVPKGDPKVNESPTDLAKETVPITEMVTRSLFAFPLGGEKVPAGQAVEVNGLAWDAGKGIATVEVSADGGKTWNQAKLDPELGRFSWRRWRYPWTPAAGKHALLCRATSAAAETQVERQWNRSGYARNVIERVEVEAG